MGFCSQFSTACGNTMTVSKAVSFTILSRPTTLPGLACDANVNTFLVNSPGVVDSLAKCSELCQASTQCVSLTFYPSKFCSHFSTACLDVVSSDGATTVRFSQQVGTPGVGWALVGAFGRQCSADDGEIW